MERCKIPSYGMARMLIEDGLMEMSIQQAPWQREAKLSILKDQRFYNIPVDAIKITDILVKNHLNSKEEYRSIPRLLHEPKVKDTKKSHGYLNEYNNSDLNDTVSNTSEIPQSTNVGNFGSTPVATPDTVGSRAMEYGYYIKGNKLAIVEKALYSDPSGDVVNDTDAYQKSDYSWRTPLFNSESGIVIRYAYNPTYSMAPIGEHGGVVSSEFRVRDTYIVKAVQAPRNVAGGGFANAAEIVFVMGIAGQGPELSDVDAVDVTGEPYNNYFEVGRWCYVDDLGYLSGFWEFSKIGGDSGAGAGTYVGLKRPVEWYGGQTDAFADLRFPIGSDPLGMQLWKRLPILNANITTLYTEQDEFYLPITQLQGMALACYIKGKMAEEVGELEVSKYYEKEFKSKLAQQETAYMSGPRMVSPGPFALKR